MSWLIVVGVLVAVALAVHVYEQRRSRRVIAARRAARLRSEEGLQWFEHVREVKERWRADLGAMTLEIQRSGSEPSEAGSGFRLARTTNGAWHMSPVEGPASGPERPLPAAIAQPLEAQYQRFNRTVAKPGAGK
jgi:hypothetical protein